MENQKVSPQDRSVFAGRATGVKNAQTSGEDIAPQSGGKRTMGRPDGPGVYNPIQGSFTRLNPSSMKMGQQDRSLSRDVTPERMGVGSYTEKNYKSYRNDYTNLLKGSQSVSNVNQPQHKVYDPATQETTVPILELNNVQNRNETQASPAKMAQDGRQSNNRFRNVSASHTGLQSPAKDAK